MGAIKAFLARFKPKPEPVSAACRESLAALAKAGGFLSDADVETMAIQGGLNEAGRHGFASDGSGWHTGWTLQPKGEQFLAALAGKTVLVAAALPLLLGACQA
jgi:hypothetical protein